MTEERKRVDLAVRQQARLQTVSRHMSHALKVLQEAELEAANELVEARNAVHEAEHKKVSA